MDVFAVDFVSAAFNRVQMRGALVVLVVATERGTLGVEYLHHRNGFLVEPQLPMMGDRIPK